MLLVLALAAAIWGLGWALGLPRAARWPLIGLLFVAVLGIQFLFPQGHALRAATGGEPALWLLLAGFVAVILAYRHLLGRVRARAQGQEAPPPPAAAPGRPGCAPSPRE